MTIIKNLKVKKMREKILKIKQNNDNIGSTNNDRKFQFADIVFFPNV